MIHEFFSYCPFSFVFFYFLILFSFVLFCKHQCGANHNNFISTNIRVITFSCKTLRRSRIAQTALARRPRDVRKIARRHLFTSFFLFFSRQMRISMPLSRDVMWCSLAMIYYSYYYFFQHPPCEWEDCIRFYTFLIAFFYFVDVLLIAVKQNTWASFDIYHFRMDLAEQVSSLSSEHVN